MGRTVDKETKKRVNTEYGIEKLLPTIANIW